MFRTLIATLMLALCITYLGFAQQETSKPKKSGATKVEAAALTLRGYVVDAMCAERMAGKETTMKKAAGHSKDCALEEECAAAGFGLFSDGKWYKFDPTGDALAKKAIEESSRKKGLAYEVTGTMADGKLAVATLKETDLGKVETKPEKTMEHMK